MSDSNPFEREMAAIPSSVKSNHTTDDGRRWAAWTQVHHSPFEAVDQETVTGLSKLSNDNDRARYLKKYLARVSVGTIATSGKQQR